MAPPPVLIPPHLRRITTTFPFSSTKSSTVHLLRLPPHLLSFLKRANKCSPSQPPFFFRRKIYGSPAQSPLPGWTCPPVWCSPPPPEIISRWMLRICRRRQLEQLTMILMSTIAKARYVKLNLCNCSPVNLSIYLFGWRVMFLDVAVLCVGGTWSAGGRGIWKTNSSQLFKEKQSRWSS